MIAFLLLTALAATEAYVPVNGSAWRLALGDFDGDKKKELLCGTWQGDLLAVDPRTGVQRWKVALDGFPFAVAAVDLDGDGKTEALAATGGGTLWAFTPDGKPLWRYRSDRALYNAAAGRDRKGRLFIATGGMDRTVTVLDTKGTKLAQYPLEQVAGRLATGDFEGGAGDEIFVVDRRNQGEVLRFADGQLERIWRKPLTVPESMRNWENPRGLFHAFSIDAGDTDGDGRPEIAMGDTFFNKHPVQLLRADGGAAWLSPILPASLGQWMQVYSDKTWYEFYSTAFVRIAEVDGTSPGAEVVSVTGGNLRVYSASGKLLKTAEAPVGFTDFVIDGKTLYLGSSPNGDRTIYRVALDGDYASRVASLERVGLPKAIGDDAARLREQVLAYHSPEQRKGEYAVKLFGAGSNEKSIREAAEKMRWFRKRFPYSNVRLEFSVKAIEKTPPLDPEGKPWNRRRWETDSINGTMTVEQIVNVARLIEKYELPTQFNIGHSCMPFITLDTARKILEAAPRFLTGFLSAEDEDPNEFPRFAKHFLGPLADMCRKAGKKCITKNKGLWWMTQPSRPEVFDELFRDGRGQTLLGYTEDSNSRTPEINLFARMGLRQAGLLPGLHASAIGDLFSFNRFHQWEYPKHGHPYLRMYVAHTLMGATSFEYRPASVFGTGDAMEFVRMARESLEPFLHMLGKGLVFAPEPGDQVGISRIGLAVHPPPVKWLEDAHNGHSPERWTFDADQEAAVIPRNGALWGNTPTPEHALQYVLLNKRRQFGYFVPPTPYGPFAIVPARADLKKVAGVEEWWHTDGVSVWREGGVKLTGMAAAKAVQASFEKAAAKLPFRAFGDDVFLHSVRMGEGVYRVYGIDPGWLDPQVRNVQVAVQRPGPYTVTDLLTGSRVSSKAGRIQFRVPAGGLRILEVKFTASESGSAPRDHR